MMKKYIGLVCGAVLLAALAAGCSGAFGFDGKGGGDGGLGVGGGAGTSGGGTNVGGGTGTGDSSKENPFKGTTWECSDADSVFTLAFTSDDVCKITEGTAVAASIARAATAGQISADTYSYTWKVNDDGSFTATLTIYNSTRGYATFTITASGESGTLTITASGAIYPFKKTTGGSTGGDDVFDGENPFVGTTWKAVDKNQTLVFTAETIKLGDTEYVYTLKTLTNGKYEAELTTKATPPKVYGTFRTNSFHAPYGNLIVGSSVTSFLKDGVVASGSADGLAVTDGKLVKYTGSQKSITIPKTVTYIGDEAFKDCAAIECVRIPVTVESIGKDAFSGCSGLKTVLYDGSKDDWQHMLFYYDKDGDGVVAGKIDVTGLKGKTIVSTTKSNLGWAFNDAVSYWRMQGYAEFYHAVGLQVESYSGTKTDIKIPIGATDIIANPVNGDKSNNMSKITSVTISDTVTSIGDKAFYSCKSLQSVMIPGSVTSIGEYAFYSCASLMDVTIPGSVKSIGTQAFYECSALTDVTISDGVESIGKKAFLGCENLQSVTIPGSVESIGESAFSVCEMLTDVTISEGVKSIGEYAFATCKKLQSVTISGSVESIGERAFSACESLTSMTINEGVTDIGKAAFERCIGLTTVTIPGSVKSIGVGAFWECESLTDLTISEGVTKIGQEAFRKCTALKSVTIPASMESVENNAFEECTDLTEVTICEGVKGIGAAMFSKCTKLKAVEIPGSVDSIGVGAFEGCTSLESAKIAEGVKSIWNSAFENCTSLTEVTIPKSVTTIRDRAFAYCRKLAEIQYGGTQTQWNSINFGKDWNLGTNDFESNYSGTPCTIKYTETE